MDGIDWINDEIVTSTGAERSTAPRLDITGGQRRHGGQLPCVDAGHRRQPNFRIRRTGRLHRRQRHPPSGQLQRIDGLQRLHVRRLLPHKTPLRRHLRLSGPVRILNSILYHLIRLKLIQFTARTNFKLFFKSHSRSFVLIVILKKIFVLLLSYYQLYFTHNSFVTFYPLTSVACKQLYTIYSITNTKQLINTVNKSTDQLITSFQQSSIVLIISQGASFYNYSRVVSLCYSHIYLMFLKHKLVAITLLNL